MYSLKRYEENLISGHCLLFAAHPFPLTGTNQQSSQIITWYGSGYYQIGFIVLDFIGDTKGFCHFSPQRDEVKHTITGLHHCLIYQISILSEKLDQSVS